jgi:cellulose synthase/poly-beta-1,6-N-acetylglucosamine synthase-like glycosyltransferase/peptidoglycan/xylan/chitin deacetylase (PgdA/CDA1 family)
MGWLTRSTMLLGLVMVGFLVVWLFSLGSGSVELHLPQFSLSSHPLLTGLPIYRSPDRASHAVEKRRGPQRIIFYDGTSGLENLALEQHAGEFDIVIGKWFDLISDLGTVAERNDPDADTSIQERARLLRKRHPTVEMIGMMTLDRTDSIPQSLYGAIVKKVADFDLDGVLIDCTELEDPDFQELQGVVEKISSTMRKEGKRSLVMVPGAWQAGLTDLAAASDMVIVQLFDLSENAPHPLAPFDWTSKVTDAAARQIPAEKLVFAIGALAMNWSSNGSVEQQTFSTITRLSRSTGSPVIFDQTSRNPVLRYKVDNTEHQAWLLDGATAFNQIKIALPHHPAAFALWEIGYEDGSLWSLLSDFSASSSPTSLQSLSASYAVESVGQGEVATFQWDSLPGRRALVLTEGLITDERLTELPRPITFELKGARPNAIALTFDDGPQPGITDKILDILAEKKVPATFFVTGWQSLRHPELIRRIMNEGHEIGNHSWSHPDLTKLPDEAIELELNTTQRMLQAITGRSFRLFRPPYSGDTVAGTSAEARVVAIASRLGYLTVGANLNPEDWRGIGSGEIVERVMAKAVGGSGSVVELHDAGGDRASTVAALPVLIDRLRQSGFHFVKIADLIDASNVHEPVALHDRVFVSLARVDFRFLLALYKTALIVLVLCIGLTALRFLMIFVLVLIPRRKRDFTSGEDPEVSVIIPAFNEEKVIARTINAIISARYPQLKEIIIVDDGSTDGTAQTVLNEFRGDLRVKLFTQRNLGKSAALNLAVSQATSDILVMIDADTIIHKDTLRLLARRFIKKDVGGVAGHAIVGNRSTILGRLQALEYAISQNLERAGLERIDAITVIPGALGAWRKQVVQQAGGFSNLTLAEDCDLTLEIHRLGFAVEYEPAALGWTEAPERWRALVRQRTRWNYGTLQAAFRHAGVIFRDRRPYAWLSLPSILVFGLILPLINPIIDLALIFSLMSLATEIWMHPDSQNFGSSSWMIAAFVFVFLLDGLMAAIAFALGPREDRRLLLYLPIQRFFYRQMLSAVSIIVLARILKGRPQGWNKLERTGLNRAASHA